MDAVVAELARSCVLMSRARALAAWVGPGRPVSAGLPDRERSAGYRAFGRVTLGETVAAELLVECGVIVHPTMAVTPLGRWARDALGAPVAPASRWDDDDILQLKISLDRVRPPVWRRVQMPAGTSLGDLHRVNQVAFDWDGDHLHVFTVDEIHYSDPTYELMDCADEETTTLGSVLPRPGASIGYRYDLGDCWDHTVTLEKVLALEPDRCYPTCTAGRGDAPVEDADPDDPPPRPFHRDDINARFAPLDVPASRAQT